MASHTKPLEYGSKTQVSKLRTVSKAAKLAASKRPKYLAIPKTDEALSEERLECENSNYVKLLPIQRQAVDILSLIDPEEPGLNTTKLAAKLGILNGDSSRL
jgi:hypothetical protein